MENLTEVVRSTKLLKIQGFSTTGTMADTDVLKSGDWSVGGYDWEIQVRPNKRIMSQCNGIGIDLFFLSEARTESVKTTFRCGVVDPSGRFKLSEDKTASMKFRRSGEFTGIMLETRHNLESVGYIKDDSVTIECTLAVLKELPDIAASNRPASHILPSSGLHHHLGELMREGTGADVTLVVSGESFMAHKIILAARSPVFMAEFFGHMKEKSSQRIEIKDMEATVFGAMLQLIYTDMAPDLDRSEDGMAMGQHLLAAADRYGIERLKLICEDNLFDGISIDTAATTLALAHQHGCSLLKAKCVEHIVANVEAVMETEGYKHLIASCPSVLSDLLKAMHGKKN